MELCSDTIELASLFIDHILYSPVVLWKIKDEETICNGFFREHHLQWSYICIRRGTPRKLKISKKHTEHVAIASIKQKEWNMRR
jgi:hypothetical protein